MCAFSTKIPPRPINATAIKCCPNASKKPVYSDHIPAYIYFYSSASISKVLSYILYPPSDPLGTSVQDVANEADPTPFPYNILTGEAINAIIDAIIDAITNNNEDPCKEKS